jgi:micrococcal nuclease
MKIFLCLLILLLPLYIMPAVAAEVAQADGAVLPPKGDFTELRLTDSVTVARVIDTLHLELQDGQIVQLSGLDVPDLDRNDPGNIAVASTTFLREVLSGKQIRLYQTKTADNGRVNRMGDLLAQVERDDGNVWVQGLLLANGLARIYPTVRNPEMAVQMLKLENDARTKKLGLWADPQYGVLPADKAGQALHSMAVIEGKILSTSVYDNRVFLNFGPDWHTDFTIGITPAMRRKFDEAGLNPLDFANRRVRVHGWVEDYNGPYIELASPVWLEFLP